MVQMDLVNPYLTKLRQMRFDMDVLRARVSEMKKNALRMRSKKEAKVALEMQKRQLERARDEQIRAQPSADLQRRMAQS
jgi:hypothetical protein